MGAAKLNDISIKGVGVIQGGEYNRASISGSGKIDGDIQANEITISGSGKIDGNVQCGKLTVSGSTKITGTIHGETLLNNGSILVDEDVKMMEITNKGSAVFRESVKVSSLKSKGALSIDEDLDAELFHSIGAFQVKETLTAKNAIIEVNGKCYAEKIRVDEIEVKHSPQAGFTGIVRWINNLLFGKSNWNRLVTESIIGSKINVDYVSAEMICGDDVTIGPNTTVDEVQYRSNLKIDPKAKVKKQVRIES